MFEHDTAIEIGSLNLEQAVQRVRENGTVVLTTGNRPVAALLSIEELKRLNDERELLRRLALGELESAGGEGDELSAVLEDCRLLLEEN
ncbi:MAG: type II toxin-antitoxin system prevent-host-death family antitoxin [Thermoanaerobaculales bacterium]|jgi:prevent-host-death family protein|nr:type II toxin-antitoxin system prevent-host-death family antitoxin [Thermoanaerobaculales bacterium]